MDAIIESMDIQQELSNRAINSPQIQAGLLLLALDKLNLYEKLKTRAAG